MATKANPGKFDCYANAADDEPMFILLARDPVAADFVRMWRALRAGNYREALAMLNQADAAFHASGKERLSFKSEKSIEAGLCAVAMDKWYMEQRKAKRSQREQDSRAAAART